MDKVYVVMIDHGYDGEQLDRVFADESRAEEYCQEKNADRTSPFPEYYVAEQEVL